MHNNAPSIRVAPANHTHGVDGVAFIGHADSAGSGFMNTALFVDTSAVSSTRFGQISGTYAENHMMSKGVKVGGTATSGGASSSATTGGASGSTANSSAFNTGGASGNTANSSAFNSGAASGDTANSTAFDSGATGSGEALDIMPPYLSVYMWKRTA